MLLISTSLDASRAKMLRCASKLLNSKANELSRTSLFHSSKIKCKRVNPQALPSLRSKKIKINQTIENCQQSKSKLLYNKSQTRIKSKAKAKLKCARTTKAMLLTSLSSLRQLNTFNLGLLPPSKATNKVASRRKTWICINLRVLRAYSIKIAADLVNSTLSISKVCKISVFSSHPKCKLTRPKPCQPEVCLLQRPISLANTKAIIAVLTNCTTCRRDLSLKGQSRPHLEWLVAGNQQVANSLAVVPLTHPLLRPIQECSLWGNLGI